MIKYKIKSLTDTLPKRNSFYKKNVDFFYVNNMKKKVITVRPGEEIYLIIDGLPLSLKKLMMKGLLLVSENAGEQKKQLQPSKKTKSALTKSTLKSTPKYKKKTKKEE